MAQISYQNKNYMPTLSSSEWALNKAVINTNGTVTISPGGLISCYIDSLTDKSFAYMKTLLDVTSQVINNESNFNNQISFYIKQYYYNENHVIHKQLDTVLGVNTYEPVDEAIGRYKDINELVCRTDLVAGVFVVLFNGTESDLTVNNIALYISQDINKHQASDIYNESLSNSIANKLIMKLDRVDGGVVGMEILGNSGSDLYNFRFLSNKLSTVISNTGWNLLVDYEYVAGSSTTSDT